MVRSIADTFPEATSLRAGSRFETKALNTNNGHLNYDGHCCLRMTDDRTATSQKCLPSDQGQENSTAFHSSHSWMMGDFP